MELFLPHIYSSQRAVLAQIKRILWIIAFIAIIGFSFAACDRRTLNNLTHQYHDWGGWKTTIAPTCYRTGEETRTCSECGATQSRTLEETAHDWNWVWEGEEGTKTGDALVETDFEVTGTCSGCYNIEQHTVGFLFGSWVNMNRTIWISISKNSYYQNYNSNPIMSNLTWTAVTRNGEAGFDISGTSGETTYNVSVYFSGDGIRTPEFPGTFSKER